jgi:protein gp37
MKQAKRHKGKCEDDRCYRFVPHYHWERFLQPLKVKKPSRIGVGFMGDMFDAAFSISLNQRIISIIEQAMQHTFLCLTKQSKNLLTFNDNWQAFPQNLWMGVTVNRKEDLHRIEDLKQTDAKVKFVSFEPLYEDLGTVDLREINWVIIGAQTRPKLLPQKEWVDQIDNQATLKNIPVFFKNNLREMGLVGWIQEFPLQTQSKAVAL